MKTLDLATELQISEQSIEESKLVTLVSRLEAAQKLECIIVRRLVGFCVVLVSVLLVVMSNFLEINSWLFGW